MPGKGVMGELFAATSEFTSKHMTPAARAAAAMEILSDVMRHHRPALAALADWGRTHRFAGSGDRAAIGTIVLDALRRRASLAWRMEDDSPRALVLGWLAFIAGHAPEEIARFATARHGFGALSAKERQRLAHPRALDDAPPWVRGDYPQWLHEHFTRAFGAEAVAAGQALAQRAPLDIRVNTLLANREEAMAELARHAPQVPPYSPWALRFHENDKGRLPHLAAELAFARGWFEIQDEGSQIAAALCEAAPGEQVLDLCAGGGGKTLALAAMMHNEGRVIAHDAELARLSPLVERARRAGARNIDIIPPHEKDKLRALKNGMDVVLVDAPCTGTGTWRRRPDAKWRLKPRALERHVQAQRQLLDEAASYVRPGGRLVYVTCSVLPPENDEQARAFAQRHAGFTLKDWRGHASLLTTLPDAPAQRLTLQLAPHRHATDGFFIAVFQREK